jgi:hypothetical protein
MPGMNLAKSAQQGKFGSGRHFGPGLIFLVSVVVFVGLLWIGFSIYDGVLSDNITSKESQIVDERKNMSPEKVDKVTDFQFRLERIAAGRGDMRGPSELLDATESLILPGVALSQYTYDVKTQTVEMKGETDSLKTVVQQMTLLKKMSSSVNLSTPTLMRNKDGRIDFSFLIAFGQ